MINFSFDFSLNNSFSLTLLFSLVSLITGVSNPAESNNTIFLYSYPSKSGYLILKPSVDILGPEGKSILDIFDNKNDFPLSAFPITPIFNTGSFFFPYIVFFLFHLILFPILD